MDKHKRGCENGLGTVSEQIGTGLVVMGWDHVETWWG